MRQAHGEKLLGRFEIKTGICACDDGNMASQIDIWGWGLFGPKLRLDEYLWETRRLVWHNLLRRSHDGKSSQTFSDGFPCFIDHGSSTCWFASLALQYESSSWRLDACITAYSGNPSSLEGEISSGSDGSSGA